MAQQEPCLHELLPLDSPAFFYLEPLPILARLLFAMATGTLMLPGRSMQRRAFRAYPSRDLDDPLAVRASSASKEVN